MAGQVALITGGAGAIGRAISKGLVGAGAGVALVDIDGERLQRYGEELEARYGSGKVLTIVADVCNSQQVRNAFDLTFEEFGRLDMLVNNAGIRESGPVDSVNNDVDTRDVTAVAKGPWGTSAAAGGIDIKGSGSHDIGEVTNTVDARDVTAIAKGDATAAAGGITVTDLVGITGQGIGDLNNDVDVRDLTAIAKGDYSTAVAGGISLKWGTAMIGNVNNKVKAGDITAVAKGGATAVAGGIAIQ